MKLILIISMMSMCWWRNNIIMMLLSLELLLITVFVTYSFNLTNNLPPTLLVFLTMMVTASSFGLSLLILISRTHSSSSSLPIISLSY